MAGLRAVVISAVLMALILVVVGHNNKKTRHYGGGGHGGGGQESNSHEGGDHGYQIPCTTDPSMYHYYPPCSTTSTSPTPAMSTKRSTTSTTEDNPEEIGESTGTTTSASNIDTTAESTSLERAHWCRLGNGTYLPLDYTYMNTVCSLCRCTKLRSIHCQSLKCMPTYCIDNTMPVRKDGQCCTQCGYDLVTNASCTYNGVSFPHGVVMKAEEDKMQCWCELGHIECRNYIGSLFGSLNILADTGAIYIILIIVFLVVFFGLLLCCGSTAFFYYYYQTHQHAFQQAYDQYFNSAGWQPVDEGEENLVESSAEEKRLEAEKYQYSDSVDESVPPPYAEHDDSFVSGEEPKKL